MEIDLVYTWVNGNDPLWRKKKNETIGEVSESSTVNCSGRFADNEELRFSLRSVEKYAPWIRRIFIVTDNQVPDWLDLQHPKIRIVDHKEILPPEALPTFNSVVIEHALFNIPELGEHFLYANDDMFFNRPVSPADFFTNDGVPIIRMNRRPLRKFTLWLKEKIQRRKLSVYNLTILNAANLVEKKYGKYIGDKTHHNIDAYNRSDYIHAFRTFEKEISPTLSNHVRKPTDIQRAIYSYVPLVEKRGKLKYVDQRTSFRFHIDNHKHYAKLEKYNPMLFCLNDSEYASDEDRKLVGDFLNRRFPEKSSFEI